MDSDEEKIAQGWSNYWRKKAVVEQWDTLSDCILATLLQEAGTARDLHFLEAGCGTGRISRALGERGAALTCLDVSAEALQIAGRQLQGLPSVTLAQDSILSMKGPYQADIVWSSGVLEHFHPPDQRLAIGNFLRACRPGGRVVLLTPYRWSLPYRLAKAYLEWRGRWPYGREVPLASMAGVVPADGVLEREFTISFLPFFWDAYKFVPVLEPLCRSHFALTRALLGSQRLWAFDNLLSRWLGGYLLVSVVRPREAGQT